MPAVSEAQRRYLYAHFGPAWVKAHHFDNKGPLPDHAPERVAGRVVRKRRRRRHTR